MKLHFNKGEVTDGWNTDPFVLTENDNKLYGLGACDMKKAELQQLYIDVRYPKLI